MSTRAAAIGADARVGRGATGGASRLLLLVLPVLASASSASALTVTLNPDPLLETRLEVLAGWIGGSLAPVDTLNPSGLPFAETHQITAENVTNEGSYQLSHAGFEITFDQIKGSDEDFTRMAWTMGAIFFSVSHDVGYQLEGVYETVAEEGEFQYVLQEATLLDRTTRTELFEGYQESTATFNERFVLGLAEGDSNNILEGSLTGALATGHQYVLFYGATLRDMPGGPPATGEGYFRLTFVPEPVAAQLLASGLAAVAWIRRRARTSRYEYQGDLSLGGPVGGVIAPAAQHYADPTPRRLSSSSPPSVPRPASAGRCRWGGQPLQLTRHRLT